MRATKDGHQTRRTVTHGHLTELHHRSAKPQVRAPIFQTGDAALHGLGVQHHLGRASVERDGPIRGHSRPVHALQALVHDHCG
jgi:hypothetical protein